MGDLMARDWSWALAHAVTLVIAAGTGLLALILAVIWLAARRGSLAKALRAVAIPLVLLYEGQGLFKVTLRVGVPRDLAYILSGVACAVVLTFAAYAHEHHKRNGTLGPNGRMMWYVAIPMGLIVAANSSSPAEAGLRLVLPLLSVMAFRAAYVPDEPAGVTAKQGSWRLTPRRLGVALGLVDPADTDLVTVHAERAIRLLTRHAAGYHRGVKALRGWHGWRFERLALMATDEMISEAASRVRRVHEGLAGTAPGEPGGVSGKTAEKDAERAPGTAAEKPVQKAPQNTAGKPAEQAARKPTKAQAKKMSGTDLAAYVGTMLEASPGLTQQAVMGELHVGIGKAREALRVAKRDRTVVPLGTRRTSGE